VAGCGKHACVEDKVVAHADDGGSGLRLTSGGGESGAFFKLGEEFFNGRGRLPGLYHAEVVGIKSELGDGVVVGPEMLEHLEAGDVGEADDDVAEGSNKNGRNGVNELVA
jgi:hypothetical protein